MTPYRRYNLLLLLIVLIPLLALCGLALQPSYSEWQALAGTATAVFLAQNAPTVTPSPTATHTSTPTPSDTPSPTATATNTPTATPTSLPTATPTIAPSPTSVPCLATVKSDAVDPRIYRRPSTGRTIDGLSISRGAEVRLYARLKDEPWWQVSLSNAVTPQGWLRVTDVTPAPTCQNIPQVTLEAVAASLGPGEVIVSDTFDTSTYLWMTDSGIPVAKIVDTEFDQVFLSLPPNGLQVARLDGVALESGFLLQTSFERSSSGLDSYVGLRFYSGELRDTYVELQFLRQQCAYIYHLVVGGREQLSTIEYPLGEDAGCSSGHSSLISLDFQYNDENPAVILQATYNDASLQEFYWKDENRVFEKVTLELLSYQTRTEFQYVLITAR